MVYLYKGPDECPVLPNVLHMADWLHIGNTDLLPVCNIVTAADVRTGKKKITSFASC